jgi:hypothetical protein
MDTEGERSLRDWARKNEVWEPETWKSFLKDDLAQFYECAFVLNSLHEFLKSEKICGKSSLSDIKDETMRDKIRTVIYGGVEADSNLNNSFAKFMYETFGVCANDAPSFEESIKQYGSMGDNIKVSVNPDSLMGSIPLKGLVDKLDSLIRNKLCDELGIELAEIGLQVDYPCHPITATEPDTLLPQSDESPKELVSLINGFRQKAMDMSIGVNPFTTFVFYARTIPLRVLMEFLGCDVRQATKLIGFLGFKTYSMIDQTEVDLPTETPDNVISLMADYSLSDKILELQDSLMNVDPTIKETHGKMIAESLRQIHITLDPWMDYKPIFSFLYDISKDRDWCSLSVENGRIVKIQSGYSESELNGHIYIRDFLIKISPIVCAGAIQLSSMTGLKFHPLARGWIGGVVENEGET